MYLYINYYQFFLQSTFVDLKTTFVAANILIISNFAAKIKKVIFSSVLPLFKRKNF